MHVEESLHLPHQAHVLQCEARHLRYSRELQVQISLQDRSPLRKQEGFPCYTNRPYIKASHEGQTLTETLGATSLNLCTAH